VFDRPPLKPGQRLGPYEIVSLLGRGGMGEVYRARDTRLHRDVALKTIAPAFARDASLLSRFEQEALATAQVNHPNVAAVYDVGTVDGITFVVSELVPGQTLRDLLAGKPMKVRTAIDYAMQIAGGLAAAHEHGIIHRDLKPENILVTEDGMVKIVDFGLAKLMTTAHDSRVMTAVDVTAPGMVMGTAGYMAPEQARGQPVDHRADVFSFGAVLYEMLSGRRAFEGQTSSDVLAAILTSDPPPLTRSDETIPPAVERIVRHCLEKNRERRFQSARDVAFALEAVLSPSGSVAVPVTPTRRVPWRAIAVVVVVAFAAAVITRAVLQRAGAPILRYHRLTFRNGTIKCARFSPDGNTIVYGASWEGRPVEIFTGRSGSPESRALELRDADVSAISSTGEVLVQLRPTPDVFWSRVGTLARVPLAGGTPREILEGVNEADWSPDGSRFAIVRDVGGRSRIEYPIGNVLFSTSGWITHARISSDGKSIAFIHHPVRPDDGGSVTVVDLQRDVRVLSTGWVTASGLAWRGPEVLFTAGSSGVRALYRVNQRGQTRLVAEAPSSLTLLDVSPAGQLLMTDERANSVMNLTSRDGARVRDLSWLDYSVVRDLSNDGQTILFDESAAGGGTSYSVYVRHVDGSPAIRLGDGVASSLSRDGRWAISFNPHLNPAPLVIVPTGAGEPRQLVTPGLHHEWASWFPDGGRVAFNGVEKGHGSRLYVQSLAGGAPRPISPDGVRISWGNWVSPDGRLIAATSATRRLTIYAADGLQPPFEIPRLNPTARFIGWSTDPRFLYTSTTTNWVMSIERVEVSTGRAEHWTDIRPVEVAGLEGRGRSRITPDGNTITYGFTRRLTNLFLVDGAR
jgi:Tol biopolymer transport system component